MSGSGPRMLKLSKGKAHPSKTLSYYDATQLTKAMVCVVFALERSSFSRDAVDLSTWLGLWCPTVTGQKLT